MSERILNKHGLSLATESFGEPKNPPILLIMGACASMLWWPREFCQMLATAGFFVLRFDNRDTGLSTCYEPGTIQYSLDDMLEDAALVLDSYDLPSAHVVGASLGGMIGQLLALKHPGRVRSLTLMISGPVATLPGEELPGIDQKVLDYHGNAGDIDWGNEQEAIDFMVNGWVVTSGTRYPFDEPLIRSIAQEEYHRSKSLLSMFNHAKLSGGEWASGQLSQIKVPTLIIHGTEDPVLPFPHAQYLERTIPGARLLPLDGGGHEIHRNDWNLITREIQRHAQLTGGPS